MDFNTRLFFRHTNKATKTWKEPLHLLAILEIYKTQKNSYLEMIIEGSMVEMGDAQHYGVGRVEVQPSGSLKLPHVPASCEFVELVLPHNTHLVNHHARQSQLVWKYKSIYRSAYYKIMGAS